METAVALMIDELVELKASSLSVLASHAEPGLREKFIRQDVLIVHYIKDIELCLELLQSVLVAQKRMTETATHFTI
jgi:hypothetical protein